MKSAKTADRKSVIAESLAELLDNEINTKCPEEGINRWLDGYKVELTGCQYIDGMIHIKVISNKKPMTLVLRPVEWKGSSD